MAQLRQIMLEELERRNYAQSTDLRMIQVLLGHGDLEGTRIYLQLSNKHLSATPAHSTRLHLVHGEKPYEAPEPVLGRDGRHRWLWQAGLRRTQP